LNRVLYTIVLCLTLTSVASAQDAEEKIARSYFRLGKQLYDRADYRGALEQFRKRISILRARRCCSTSAAATSRSASSSQQSSTTAAISPQVRLTRMRYGRASTTSSG
jgi:hypothetical protein